MRLPQNLLAKILGLAIVLVAVVPTQTGCCCNKNAGRNTTATAKCRAVGSSGCNSCCRTNGAKSSSYDSTNLCVCY